jgi:sugar lactone lactonase YvrE
MHSDATARRLAGRLSSFAFAAGMVASACVAEAAPAEVAIPGERAFPENLTSTRDGTLYIGSISEGGVMRAAPGAASAEPWIAPGAGGSRSTFGMLADEGTGTFWVCSNDVSAWGIPGPGDAKGSWLKSFDLKSGAPKGGATLPGENAACNDVAKGPDGSIYVTDVINSQVLKLKAAGDGFDVWATDERFAPPPDGGGVDGLAFGSDGNLYVNTFSKGDLFRIEVKDGAAGTVTPLKTSRPLKFPDGMQAHGSGTFLLAEGGGTLDLVTIEGDTAKIETLRDGLIGPVGVTRVGDIAWVAEGQLAHLFDPTLKDKKPNLPFRLVAVPLTGR